LDDWRVGVIRGRVVNESGSALNGVQVSIHGQPKTGKVFTRNDGRFDIAVNGGGIVTLQFDLATYLPSDRQTYVPWHEYAIIDDLVLVKAPTFPPTGVALTGNSTVSIVAAPADTGSQPAALMLPAPV